MKTIKSLLLASSISISICTLLSTLNHLFFGAASEFYLVGPTGFYSSLPYFNFINFVIYALIGMVIWSGFWLVKTDNFGWKWANLVHFLVSFVSFSLLFFLSEIPLGISEFPYGQWFSANGGALQMIINPLILLFIYYLLLWISFWLYDRHQIKKLNQKLHS